MPLDLVLLAILVVVILANAWLVAAIVVRMRDHQGARQGQPVPWSPAPTGATAIAAPATSSSHGDDQPDDGDARAAAAVEAFVADVAADASGLARPPAESEVIARRQAALAGATLAGATEMPTSTTPVRRRSGAADAKRAATTAAAPAADERASTLAGLGDQTSWDRAVSAESARAERFGRPVTVVMAQLSGLDELADRLGREVADRVVAETGLLLSSNGRVVDPVAWLGEARFGVLLLETEELPAKDYVDRVRAAADAWLHSSGLSVRLSLGWASAADGRDVVAAAALARERMQDGAGKSPVRRRRSA